MRRAIEYPCSGPMTSRVLRIRRSRVPYGRSVLALDMSIVDILNRVDGCGQAPLQSRPEVARSSLNRQRRFSRHVNGDRMPAACRHALWRIPQHVALAEVVEDLREGSNGRVAKARPVRIAAGSRGALANEVRLAGIGGRAPGADAV